MYKRMFNLLGLAAFIILIAGVSAQATPIVGGFTISNTTHSSVVPVKLNGVQTFSFAASSGAVALDFTNARKPTGLYGSTPGTAGDFQVNSAAGDFLPFLHSIGQIMDFAWTGPGNAHYKNPNLGAILTWEVDTTVGEKLTVALNSVSVFAQAANSITLKGNVTFSLTNCPFSCGFSPTAGNFSLTANLTGDTFSFTSSQATNKPVPEPTTLSLLGLGLLGLGWVKRAKQ